MTKPGPTTIPMSLALVLSLAPIAGAQEREKAPCADCFLPPVRLMAGDEYLGADRLFPSPVFRDMNGDGRADLLVGDLIGKVTVALRQPGDAVAFGPEEPLEGADGEPLEFDNW